MSTRTMQCGPQARPTRTARTQELPAVMHQATRRLAMQRKTARWHKITHACKYHVHKTWWRRVWVGRGGGGEHRQPFATIAQDHAHH